MAGISMVDIGEKLKQAREKKSLTIDQAQKQTHIHSRVIAALEEGKCDEILNQAYVKSFLKTYSRYLGLDQKEIMGGYESAHPEAPRSAVSLNKQESKAAVNTARLFYIIGTVAVLIALIFSVIFLWNKTAQFMSKARPGKKAAVVKAKEIPAGTKRPSQKKNAGTTAIKPRESSRSESSVGKRSGAHVPVPKNMPFNLAIKVNQPVLIQLKKDGVLLFKRVLPKGTVESFRANDSINIFVAKSEAIEIILNGKRLDLPSRGVIKDLEITRKGIRIR